MRLGVAHWQLFWSRYFVFNGGFESGDFTQCDAFNVGQV
jgi:predicted metalloprotease